MKRFFRTQYYKPTEVIGFIAFVSVMVVQQVLRPNSQQYDESIKHLLGVMPNFSGGIAMSIAIFIYGKSKFDRYSLSPIKAMMAAVLLSILGLTLWEYIQIIAHRSFDIEDVVATILGSLLSAVVMYLNILYNKKYNRVE